MSEPSPPDAGQGPFVQVAVFCDQVIEAKDGTLSLIRVIDQVTSTVTGTDVPELMPPMPVQCKLVISLKPGKARGRYALKIRPEEPSGAQLPALEVPVHLEGGNRGINFATDFHFVANHEGLYWFDVLLVRGQDDDGALLTRLPLEVKYQPIRLTPPLG